MAQPIPDPESFLPLPPAMFHIMLVLAAGDSHGYGIMQTVAERTQGAVKLGPGTLYGAIKKMLESGWIVETEARADTALNDERRRYYRLTDIGARIARAEAARLVNLVGTAREVGLIGGEA